jgi:hypothetical protein
MIAFDPAAGGGRGRAVEREASVSTISRSHARAVDSAVRAAKERVAVKIDPAIYDPLAGRYQLRPRSSSSCGAKATAS